MQETNKDITTLKKKKIWTMTIMENGNYSLIPNYAFTAEMLSLKTQFWPRCIARSERSQPFL